MDGSAAEALNEVLCDSKLVKGAREDLMAYHGAPLIYTAKDC